MYSWKKIENRSIFGEDTNKSLQLTVLGHPVYWVRKLITAIDAVQKSCDLSAKDPAGNGPGSAKEIRVISKKTFKKFFKKIIATLANITPCWLLSSPCRNVGRRRRRLPRGGCRQSFERQPGQGLVVRRSSCGWRPCRALSDRRRSAGWCQSTWCSWRRRWRRPSLDDRPLRARPSDPASAPVQITTRPLSEFYHVASS